MADRRTAVISGFAAARAALLAAIAGVDEARLAEPAADGWSAKGHLAHVAHMDEIRYFEVCRVARGHQPAWPYETDAESAALNAMGVEHRRGLPLAQLFWELDFIRGRILDELRQAPEAALDPVRLGDPAVAARPRVVGSRRIGPRGRGHPPLTPGRKPTCRRSARGTAGR